MVVNLKVGRISIRGKRLKRKSLIRTRVGHQKYAWIKTKHLLSTRKVKQHI